MRKKSILMVIGGILLTNVIVAALNIRKVDRVEKNINKNVD